MTYPEIIQYIQQIPMFQHIGAQAYNPSLDKITELCRIAGNPQQQFKTIHVAGTNGKGSCSGLLAAAIQAAGYKTGLYTSPHLTDYRERITIDGTLIEEEEVVAFMDVMYPEIERIKPSFFEFTTVLAFWAFARKHIAIAVIETGLGGRLDATNIIRPEVCLITNISLDHKDILGDTPQAIAAEKAGIIKPQTTIVIGQRDRETDEIFENFAAQQNAPIIFAQDHYRVTGQHWQNNRQFITVAQQDSQTEYALSLMGTYQQKNLPGVLAVLNCLNHSGSVIIPQKAVLRGIENCTIPGRWQQIDDHPKAICDVGHNEAGIREILDMLEHHCRYENLFIVIGFMADKDIDKILPLLPKNAYYVFTQADTPRALSKSILAAKARKIGLKGVAKTGAAKAYAYARTMAAENDMVFVGGSSFVVADLLLEQQTEHPKRSTFLNNYKRK